MEVTLLMRSRACCRRYCWCIFLQKPIQAALETLSLTTDMLLPSQESLTDIDAYNHERDRISSLGLVFKTAALQEEIQNRDSTISEGQLAEVRCSTTASDSMRSTWVAVIAFLHFSFLVFVWFPPSPLHPALDA